MQLPSGRSIQYDYDAAGNRRRVIDDGVITAYQTNLLDQYTQVGTSLRQYDNDGNVIQEVGVNGDQTIYQYDDANQLLRVESPSGMWAYQYDAMGNRLSTDRDGILTEYQLDPRGLVSIAGEYNQSGNLIARYIHGPTGPIVRLDAAGSPLWYEMNTALDPRRHCWMRLVIQPRVTRTCRSVNRSESRRMSPTRSSLSVVME